MKSTHYVACLLLFIPVAVIIAVAGWAHERDRCFQHLSAAYSQAALGVILTVNAITGPLGAVITAKHGAAILATVANLQCDKVSMEEMKADKILTAPSGP